jgi:hypothetical protein
MKLIRITLTVSDSEAGEQLEDRLAIILGRLGFNGEIENELTGNSVGIPLADEHNSTELGWANSSIKIKRKLIE